MNIKICIYALLSLALLTACSIGAGSEPTATPIDVGAIQTAAVETVVAGVTQTAAAFTATPAPTETPTSTPSLDITETPTSTPTQAGTPTEVICDNLVFISDATVPDGMVIAAGQEFVKTWKVKNTGSCSWTTGYSIIFAYGEKLGGQTTALIAEVLSNTEAEISITLKAPLIPGNYGSYWRLANNNGSAFGTVLTVVITVQ